MRRLMAEKGINGVQLSEDIGMTPTSISRILNGVSRPRQLSLTRIMNRLCETKEEEQMLLRVYPTFSDGPEEAIIDDEKTRQEERARAEQYLEKKAQSIAFKRSVARELDKAGISYTQDYCEGIYVTDFLIACRSKSERSGEKDGKRIAIECKFNVHRDFEKTGTIAELLKENLKCDEVLVVVPFLDSFISSDLGSETIKLVPLQDILDVIML